MLVFVFSCTIGQVHLLVYYIKLKSRLSVRPSVTVRKPAVSAWIDVRFARNEVPILGVPVVSFINVPIAVVRRLRRVECTSVDDFLLHES